MPPKSGSKRARPPRKRVPKACTRCRDQKIRCSGLEPCQQCTKRDLMCHFPDENQKVLVTRKYISELHDRLAAYERREPNEDPVSRNLEDLMSPEMYGETSCITDDNLDTTRRSSGLAPASPSSSRAATAAQEPGDVAEAPLTNPLAFHTIDWVPGPHGAPVFMGTSSNWAFGRRVLTMTHEAITGTPLQIDNLFFDGNVYDLKWDGGRSSCSRDDFCPSNLPTQDFAIYLINSVKFRCGRLFYLFDEENFMKQFALFHEHGANHPGLSRLWCVHYLILLAFGKAFVVQTTRSQTPPGLDLFVHAMKIMPDFTFFECDFVEKIQVLCCAALYLQCLSCRTSAYRHISQAVSLALEGGMYTEMQGQYLDEAYVQKCRLMWWTLYVLERHMSTLLGVPMFINDENICTPFPARPDQGQRTSVMHIQVKLAQILGQIHRSVYGIDGQLDSRYLSATKSLLQSIANVAGQLNELFDIDSSENTSGVSRVSAHLHLQYHQCIVLTTRPLLFIFLQSRLGQSHTTPLRWAQSESVKGLLQVCMESCCQSIKILSRLLNQGLLESFLTFDLDATFTAAIAISMGAAIDPSLVPDHAQLTQRAHALFDEMSSHGSKISTMIASELKQLDGYLSHLQVDGAEILPVQDFRSDVMAQMTPGGTLAGAPELGMGFTDDIDFGLHFELSTEQLMQLANSLDVDSLSRPLSADHHGT